MALLEVGRIVKPHGIRGEVIVELVTDRTERLAPGMVLHTSGADLRVVTATAHHHRWIVAFEGVLDRNQADALRDTVLKAEPLEDSGALWVHELIGAEVTDPSGSVLGTVTAIEANPASDLLILGTGGMIPLRFVLSHRAGHIVVDVPQGLLE